MYEPIKHAFQLDLTWKCNTEKSFSVESCFLKWNQFSQLVIQCVFKNISVLVLSSTRFLFSVYLQIVDEESDADIVSVRRKFEDIHFQVNMSSV